MSPNAIFTRREFLAAGASVALPASAAFSEKSGRSDRSERQSLVRQPSVRTCGRLAGLSRQSSAGAWELSAIPATISMSIHERKNQSWFLTAAAGISTILAREFRKAATVCITAERRRGEIPLFLRPHPQSGSKNGYGRNSILRIGGVLKESPASVHFQFNQPTNLAVGPNGDIFVAGGLRRKPNSGLQQARPVSSHNWRPRLRSGKI